MRSSKIIPLCNASARAHVLYLHDGGGVEGFCSDPYELLKAGMDMRLERLGRLSEKSTVGFVAVPAATALLAGMEGEIGEGGP